MGWTHIAILDEAIKILSEVEKDYDGFPRRISVGNDGVLQLSRSFFSELYRCELHIGSSCLWLHPDGTWRDSYRCLTLIELQVFLHSSLVEDW